MARKKVADELPVGRPGHEWKPELLREMEKRFPHLYATMNRLLHGKDSADRDADGVYRLLLYELHDAGPGAERTACGVLGYCAKILFDHETILRTTPSPTEARIGRAAMEFYRPWVAAADGPPDTWKLFEAIKADLNRRADAAGRRGRKRKLEHPEAKFPADARIAWKALEFYHPKVIAEVASPDTGELFKAIAADLDRRSVAAGRRGRKPERTTPQETFILAMTTRLLCKNGRLSASLFKKLYWFTFREKIHPADIKFHFTELAARKREFLASKNLPSPQ